MSATPKPELPAMLYKHGSEIEWDHEWFDTLVVADDEELEAALKDGWSVGKPDKPAAKGKPAAKDA